MSTALPSFTPQEVASHNTPESLWVSIDGKVYDLTTFLDSHPGGQDVLIENAGKDASEAFADVGHSQDAVDLREGSYLIGTLRTGPAPTRAQRSGTCCGGDCTQKAFQIGAVVLGVAAIAVGIYFAYQRIKK